MEWTQLWRFLLLCARGGGSGSCVQRVPGRAGGRAETAVGTQVPLIGPALVSTQINKQNEQMHALLAIALTMYPMRIDESIHLQLREKYGDKMLRMQKGDPQVYEELFSYSCPKFLSPVVPNYDNVHPNYHKEPFLQQLKVFSDEVQQQAQLSTIRSFLKLYTTMPVAKLAGFLDLTEQEFRIQLLVFKHKMKNLVWTSGISALDGEFQSASEVDFYIDKVWLSLLASQHSVLPLKVISQGVVVTPALGRSDMA